MERSNGRGQPTDPPLYPAPRPGGLIPRRVAIVRALPGLGDLLCIVPALRALRAALPDADVTLIGLPQAQDFVDRFSAYIDHLSEFPGFPSIPEGSLSVQRFPAQLARLQALPFDLALQMHGDGSVTNLFTALLGAHSTAGFYLPGNYCPDPDRFLPYPHHEPEVLRHLRLLALLGIPSQGEALAFPISEADERDFQGIEEAAGLQAGGYVCIHPGAKDSRRRWPAEHFAAVADRLDGDGLQVVLTGTEEEVILTSSVAAAMRARPLDLTGRTSVGALAVLLRGARLVVCNDTGVSHLAAALRVPSVVIFAGCPPPVSDPLRWAPLDGERHRIVHPYGGDGTSRRARGFGSLRKRYASAAALPSLPTAPCAPVDLVAEQIELLLQEVGYEST